MLMGRDKRLPLLVTPSLQGAAAAAADDDDDDDALSNGKSRCARTFVVGICEAAL
jgi:hypothetical protein